MNKRLLNTFIILVALVLIILLTGKSRMHNSQEVQASPPQLLRPNYTSSVDGEEHQFYLYLPKGYGDDPKREWPLLLFLHGDGERGNGRDELPFLLAHGPLMEAWIYKRDLPFIIISPQLPMFGRDDFIPYLQNRDPNSLPQHLDEGVPPRQPRFATPEPMLGAVADDALPTPPEGPENGWFKVEDDLLAMLAQVEEGWQVDRRREYLTGLSYGGYGSWYFASRHPQRFAAMAPVCGWGHPDLVASIAAANLPVWQFAGGRDPVVPIKHMYPALNALEDLGQEVRFTVHEEMGHDVWRRVYAGQDLYDWLLEHQR